MMNKLTLLYSPHCSFLFDTAVFLPHLPVVFPLTYAVCQLLCENFHFHQTVFDRLDVTSLDMFNRPLPDDWIIVEVFRQHILYEDAVLLLPLLV